MANFELCTEVSKSSLISDYCYFYFFKDTHKLLIYKISIIMQFYSFVKLLSFNEFLAPQTFKNSICIRLSKIHFQMEDGLSGQVSISSTLYAQIYYMHVFSAAFLRTYVRT